MNIEALSKEDNCDKCGLYQYSKCPKIQGRGNDIDPRIVFIGEAPGPDEAKVGTPFIGRARKKLTAMIATAFTIHNLTNEDYYVTNMVKCFPPISTTYPEKGFRVPKLKEMELCKPFLVKEFEKFTNKPIIMSLGNVALTGLVGENKGITKELGIIRTVKVGSSFYKLIPNYHPSFILRNNNYQSAFLEILEKACKEVK